MATHPPLARKLLILIGTILLGGMVAGSVAFAIYESSALRRALVSDLEARAAMVAITAEPPLRFANPEDGAMVLTSLRGAKNIRRAALYSATGELFASYPAGTTRPAFPATLPAEATARFEGGHLEVFAPIRPDGESLGWIYLQSGLEEVGQRIRVALLAQGLILLAVVALVLLLVPRLQRSITDPIHHLAETAGAISASEDYGLRVRVEGGVEELHALGRSFNDMVARLQKHKEHLEGEVAARTLELLQVNRDLMEAKEKAEEASKAKSAFLASMSHELRTPLNAVLGFAQIMAREPERSRQDRSHLDKIMGAGEHLLALINDVLSVARIEARRLTLNPQPFDTRQLVDAVQSMIRVRSKAKGLSFDVEVDEGLPTFALGDEGKLRQVLLNLLGNAVKFTERGGVGLRIFALPGGAVRFQVVDTGPGIAPEEVPHLFGIFMQTESGRRSSEGSGLGLHLSQALVGLMGGRIELRSEPGRGSVFSFEIQLPACERVLPSMPVRRRFQLASGQQVPRHLVADDKEDNRELLQELLESAGFAVRAVNDGQAAVEAWEAWKPQVVWMDMRMPVMDGFEATRRIRVQEAERGLPRTTIFAVTASVFEHDQAAILEAGCDAMMGKPFREQELFELVEGFTGARFRIQDLEPLPSPVSTPADVAALAPDWREAFLNALALGDIEGAARLVDRLPEAMVGLAAEIRHHLEAFQMDDLERLFSPKEPP